MGLCVSNPSVVEIPLDKKDGDETSHVVVMPTPSKRGRKKKVTMSVPRIGGGAGHPNETLILAHLSATGQVKMFFLIKRDVYMQTFCSRTPECNTTTK